MAVQAQYPSNVLLLNRNGQDRKNMVGGDYSMQGQAGGLLDQSQMLFSSGGVNPRKRGREAVVAGGATPINLFALQPPPHPTLVNLAQLQNQQQAVVSTGLRLSFEDHQQQQQQQQQQMGLLLPSSNLSFVLSEDLSAQIKRQRDEIDQFLQAQGDQLRRTLAERRQRHYRALLSAAEESAARRLREKDADVGKASRRNAELEERVAQLKAEAQVWQARARAQEATAASLHSQLQQAMMGGVGLGAQDRREDAGCAGGELPADDAESAHIDPGRVVSSVPPCRTCRKRAMTVVLLPCRHLCVCTNCDSAIDVCPICNSVRSASVEVYLS